MASFAMKSAVCGTPLAQRSAVKPGFSRAATVVRASGDEASRRAFLGAVFSGAALIVSRGAEAIDIIDDRKNVDAGYNLIYEARDFDLPQSTRDGIDQSRADLPGTKKRVAESIERLKKELPKSIEKQYWVQGREELRRQLGNFRMDLETIATSLEDKQSRKNALRAADGFFVNVEVLDDALRQKNQDLASKAFDKAVASLGDLFLG